MLVKNLMSILDVIKLLNHEGNHLASQLLCFPSSLQWQMILDWSTSSFTISWQFLWVSILAFDCSSLTAERWAPPYFLIVSFMEFSKPMLAGHLWFLAPQSCFEWLALHFGQVSIHRHWTDTVKCFPLCSQYLWAL